MDLLYCESCYQFSNKSEFTPEILTTQVQNLQIQRKERLMQIQVKGGSRVTGVVNPGLDLELETDSYKRTEQNRDI